MNSDRTCCSTTAERVREYEMSKPERDHRPAFSSAHRRNGCTESAESTHSAAAPHCLFGARPSRACSARTGAAAVRVRPQRRRCGGVHTPAACRGEGLVSAGGRRIACRPFLYRLPFLTKLTIEILYACLPPALRRSTGRNGAAAPAQADRDPPEESSGSIARAAIGPVGGESASLSHCCRVGISLLVVSATLPPVGHSAAEPAAE